MRRLLCAAVLFPVAAAAHEIELSGASSLNEKSSASPRAGSLGTRLEGSIDLGDIWTLDIGAAYTHEFAGKPTQGGAFKPKGGDIFTLSSSIGRLFGDHLYADLGITFSPPSTTESTTGITLSDGADTPADILLAARTNTVGGTAMASWDSGGNGGWRWRFLLLGSVDRSSTEQSVSKLSTASGEVNVAKAASSCAKNNTGAVCDRLGALIDPAVASMVHGAVMGGLTVRISAVHEASIGGTWHGYSRSATETAYFSLAQAGRGAFSLSGGVPVSPLAWEASTGYARQFGSIKAGFTANAGAYTTGGSTLGLSLRANWKISETWRLWMRGSSARDVDADGAAIISGTGAVGFAYAWETESAEPDDDSPDTDEPK